MQNFSALVKDCWDWVLGYVNKNSQCLRHSLIRWLIGHRHWCVLFAAFLLPGHLSPRLYSSSLLTVFFIHLLWSSGVHTLSVRFERLQHLFWHSHCTNWLMWGHHLKFLLLRLLQRGNKFSKESINPNSSKILQLFLPLRISIHSDGILHILFRFLDWIYGVSHNGYTLISGFLWLLVVWRLWRSLELGEDALLFSTYS